MRFVRIGFGLMLMVAVMTMWQRRDEVAEAYTSDHEPVVFDFDGLDLELTPAADLAPSPLAIPSGPDTGQVALASIRVESGVTPATGILPGTLNFAGRVVGPDGPVAEAVVRLEHHRVDPNTGDSVVASIDLASDLEGNWALDDVSGGRWKIRAFVPSVLASVAPTLSFYDADATQTLDLVVAPADPTLVLDTSAPDQLEIGWSGTAAVTVGRRRVDENGAIVIDPVPGAVARLAIDAPAPLRLASSADTATTQTGAATYSLICDRPGTTGATVTVSLPLDTTITTASPVVPSTAPVETPLRSITLPLPECVLPPPPPEADPDAAPTEDPGTPGG